MKDTFDTSKALGSRKVIPVPHWKPYAGFSYLFDNPGNSLHMENNLNKIQCQIKADPALKLYKVLADCVEHIGGNTLINEYLLFPLPSDTYHVTVWDGVNIENLDKLSEPAHTQCREFFNGLPTSALSNWPSIIPHSKFDEVTAGSWTVRFKFNGLRVGGSTVLMAWLNPADDSSKETLKLIREERDRLDEYYAKNYQKEENAPYLSHIALGYFSNPRIAQQVWKLVSDNWLQYFEKEVGESVIQFESISLYAFSDMLTYFRKNKASV